MTGWWQSLCWTSVPRWSGYGYHFRGWSTGERSRDRSREAKTPGTESGSRSKPSAMRFYGLDGVGLLITCGANYIGCIIEDRKRTGVAILPEDYS